MVDSKTLSDDSESAIYELEDAVGVVQHHDGVSGTSMQHVANDYAMRLQSGIDHVSIVTAAKLRRIFFGDNATSDILADLSLCQRLNETSCSISQVIARCFFDLRRWQENSFLVTNSFLFFF